jgi:guanine deaminase
MELDLEKVQWIFRGNIVVPTRNPFSAPREPELDDERCRWIGPGLKLLIDHVLYVNEEGSISELRPASLFAAGAIDSPRLVELSKNEFLCPGMIDLHIHAAQYAYTGTATDRPLMGPNGWLETYTFPAEQRLGSDPSLARQVYEGVVRNTLLAGTTTAVYFATLHLDPCKVLVDIALEEGQRALVGKVCMDRHSPLNYTQTVEMNLKESEELIEYIQMKSGQQTTSAKLPLVLPLITPRFIPTCSPALLTALGKLAAERSCHVTSHISESVDEVAFSRQLDASEGLDNGVGRTDAKIFDGHGLLTDKCVMAHGVFLSEDDLDLLQRRGSAVAHCPLSNFCFAGKSLHCRNILQRGGPQVGLGTDVAGGYSPSMLHSSRMTVVASQSLQHQAIANNEDVDHVLDYRHGFYLDTLGGAKALKLDNRIGSLAVGKEFDAMILSADVDSPIQLFDSDNVLDVFQKLCVLGDDRNIKAVYVQGRRVKDCNACC